MCHNCTGGEDAKHEHTLAPGLLQLPVQIALPLALSEGHARAISTKMQKDAHLHQHKSRPPRQVLGARVGTVGWPGVQGVAGRPGKRLRPRPVAHSPGPTAPEVAEERHTTPGRSARREELVRANGSIIFRETQDLSFFGHVPPAC